MTEKNSKDRKTAAGCSDLDCKPEDFKKMFEMMGKCCAGKDGLPDCSAMMAGMMGTFGGQKSEGTKACCEPEAKETE
jgi:hypothetical protein